MELRHLRTFLSVAETLNISAAARQLHVTQPALSRHIHELENEVGHPLFERHPGGLRLTVAGRTLRDHSAKAVASVDEALRFARNAGPEGEAVLRVGYYGAISVWSGILSPAFEKLRRGHPNLTSRMVELAGPQLAEGLREGELDVALLGPGEYGRIPGVIVQIACRIPAYAMMPANHRLAKKRSIDVAELRDETIIGLSDRIAPGRYASLVEACLAKGFYPQITSDATGLPELVMFAQQRMGIVFLGALAMAVPHPGMVFVKLKPPGVAFELYAAHTEKAGPVGRELAALIVEECRRYSVPDEERAVAHAKA